MGGGHSVLFAGVSGERMVFRRLSFKNAAAVLSEGSSYQMFY